MRNCLLLLFSFFIVLNITQSQNLKFLDEDTKVSIETNIDFASSADDTRSDAQAGTGTLGLKFSRNFVYGKIRFTVFSKNDEIEAESTNDQKIFGSNLLIPQNSSNNISNFTFQLGTKSFYKWDSVQEKENLFSLKRFGSFIEFSINNTTWVQDGTILPITINSFKLQLTYRLLSLELDGKDNGRADFYITSGYTNRRLGGDYGLDKNKNLRNSFIETEDLGFDGFSIGARLELNSFFGQVNLTNFNSEISGFGGDQAVITVGFNATLNLKAKESKEE